MKKHIPNFITSLNVSSGVIGIIAAMQGYWMVAIILILVAAIFDFMDGMAARVLNAYSEIGKQLDSLADMVSFGVLPGIIMFQLMNRSLELPEVLVNNINILPFTAMLIPVFSALRLAKFNVDDRQTDSFIGLPTPANAMFIAAYSASVHFLCTCKIEGEVVSNFYSMLAVTIIFSYLLIAELPLFSLKFKNLKWPDNKIRFIFLGLSILLLIIFFNHLYFALCFIIVLYIALSVIDNFVKIKIRR